MTNKNYDIDIDVSSNTNKDDFGTRSIIYNEKTETITTHPSGYYLTKVPVDKVTGTCSIDYKDMELKGYKKVDLLTNNSYDKFTSKQDVLDHLHKEVPWEKFLDPEFVRQLPHISNHFDLVERVKPRSIDDLADILALIRPGKAHLVEDYIKDKDKTRRNLYKRPKTGAYFKKSHSYSYAHMIACVANKIHYDQEIVIGRLSNG